MTDPTPVPGPVVVIGAGGRETVLRVGELPQPHPRTVPARELPGAAFGAHAVVEALESVDLPARLVATSSHEGVSMVDDEGYGVRLVTATETDDVAGDVSEALAGASVAVFAWDAVGVAQTAGGLDVERWADLVDWDGETPAPAALVDGASAVIVSDHNIEDPLGVAGDLLDDGRACVVVTHGRAGATAFIAGMLPVYVPIVGDDGGEVSETSYAARGLVREAVIAGMLRSRREGLGWVEALRAAAEFAGR